MDRRQFNGGLLLSAGLGLFGAAAQAKTVDRPGRIVCTLVQDLENGKILFREGACDQRFSPCSTFKFPLALMGFDAGILQDARHPLWDYKPEYKADLELHRKATDPTIWLRDSVVWYSQEITRKLGMERFQRYVDGLSYGNRDLAGNPGRKDGLTQAWLMSSLQVSAEDQVQLIKRFFDRSLPVSKRACDLTLASMPSFEAEGGWAVQGKTGSGFLRDEKGRSDRSRPLGWFVGWAVRDGRKVAFARFELGNERMDSYGGPVAKAALLAGLSGMIGAF